MKDGGADVTVCILGLTISLVLFMVLLFSV